VVFRNALVPGAALIGALVAAPAHPQGIMGRVVDADTEEHVTGAAVTLVDSAGTPVTTATTDSVGSFGLPVVAPGRYTLEIGHMAYRDTETRPLAVGRDEVIEVDIRLSRLTFELDPLVVTARRETRVSYLRGYYDRVDRRHLTWGVILTREDLEPLHGHTVGTLMRRHPGTGRFMDRYGEPCPPAYYWNGLPVPAQDIPISQVEGIEIYRRREVPAEIAAEIASRAAVGRCGVVLVWSRPVRPGEGRPWSWWRLAAALAAGLLLAGQLR
jgi:hypothetical protein